MKEHPIRMVAEEVRAILDGHKTQTRRVVTPQPPMGCYYVINGNHNKACCFGDKSTRCVPPTPNSKDHLLPCHYGHPGDLLWVREAFSSLAHGRQFGVRVRYSIDGKERIWDDAPDREDRWRPVTGWKHRPSIHMPRWASRITLEITGVRVERLQEISNDDAKAEGVEFAYPHRHGPVGIEKDGEAPDQYGSRHETGWNDCYICPFRDLWNSINGHGSWSANPWVWVIEFKRVEV